MKTLLGTPNPPESQRGPTFTVTTGGGNGASSTSYSAVFVFEVDGQGTYHGNGCGPNSTHITGNDFGSFVAQVLASQREFAWRMRNQQASKQRTRELKELSKLDKLRVLAERGATKGERDAARAAIERLERRAA